jgi:hypothetical protein
MPGPVSACYASSKIFNEVLPTLLDKRLREGMKNQGVDQMIVKPGLV